MLFYQIYDELQKLNNKYAELEVAVKDNCQVSDEISESEESLHHRIYRLEQSVDWLKEKTHELIENNNKVVTELNSVIELLNNRYIFMHTLYSVGFLQGVLKKVRNFEKSTEF